MKLYNVTFLPDGISLPVEAGTTLLKAQILAGLHPDAPCGGKGSCKKCHVVLEGREHLACQTVVDRDMTVFTQAEKPVSILTSGLTAGTQPDGEFSYVLAFDLGTTTVVCYLLDGRTGALLARESCVNPQNRFGADVISRIRHALNGNGEAMCRCIRHALTDLAERVCEKAAISGDAIGTAAIAANPAMHHFLLHIDPRPLVTPPYMPGVCAAMEQGKARILPNIAGFVGGDTVGCMVATRFDRQEALTLLMDIGTNGELVLGDKHRRIACSTAAGPAFEGAGISCGMRASEGAVDRVWLENGKLRYHVIGDAAPVGLCGSGLLDLVAVLLDAGILDTSGRLKGKAYRLCQNVTLTQKDVRAVQLAKAAIQAGITLLLESLDTEAARIQRVYLAGAFGNYMDPASACRIGMIPAVLLDRIQPIGNAAGEGARLCALSREEFTYSQKLARETEFLELASLPNFQNCYIGALDFAQRDAT